MTDAYNDALAEQLEKNVWDRLKSEAANMSKLEYATLTADIAGIFDPTPASDAAGFVLSAVQLDGLGMLLSVGSMASYVGDAVAKPLKIAKRAPKTAKALEAVLNAGDNLAKAGAAALKRSGLSLAQVAVARKKALAKVQQAMMDARKKIPGYEDCVIVGAKGEKRILQMPRSGKNGKWKTPNGDAPTTGTGTFQFSSPKKLPDDMGEVTEIRFHNGAPIFDDYIKGPKYDLWDVSGDAKIDGDRLQAMMRETNPNWQPPSSKDYVLHHLENGQVGYVPRVIHDRAIGGVGHTGGQSMINNQMF